LSGPWNQYCGPPPAPAELLGSWNLDPWLIGAMASIAAAHLLLLRRTGEWPTKRSSFGAVWLILSLLFVSPFCALSSALFSARIAHHVLLIAIVAPLAAISLPGRCRAMAISPGALSCFAIVHFCVLWSWHAPLLYALALSEPAVFWAMQLSLFGTALAFWLAVLSPHTALVPSLTALLTSTIQMGLLGAIITFAPRAIYAPHFGSTSPFGLSELEDQQLAGLIMWVPAVLPYLAAALVLLNLRLSSAALASRAQ
jgi:putative membrane protein